MKEYSQINLLIRTLLFSMISLGTMIIYSVLCLLARPFSLSSRHGLIRSYLYFYIWLLKKLCYVDYRVEGLENIPRDRAGIILSKHQSTWETFFLPLIFHDPAIIIKRELLWVPFFGWGLAVSDPIAINRQNTSNAMQQVVEKGKKALAAGRWILIFPEGTRIPYGQIGKYRLGGARLAINTGYPIIPVAHNAGRYWPKKKFIKHPGTIHMVIGPLIESKNRTPEELMGKVKDWIENTVAIL